MLLVIECILVASAFVVALTAPRLGDRWLQPLEHGFARFARRRRISVLATGVSALVIRASLLPILPIPAPAVHDEFSYLLAADTFAHGRLTNPTHPMWIHFETFHEIQKPTYSSMYYPAQGLFLAVGQRFFGHPFWGVWLSTGLMCAAVCWMLQGWLPPLWALIGGLLAVIRLGTFSYWMNSYWGGSVAALGGALVLGALPRIKRHQRVRDALAMGGGFAIIANSRPYEGIFFAVPVFGALLYWMLRRGQRRRKVFPIKAIFSLALVLVMAGAATATYFWHVTGSPFRTPFQVNIATYNPVPYFPWQAVKTIPPYHHHVMRTFYLEWWMRNYELGRTHPLVLLLIKFCLFWFFFSGPLFVLPLLAVCFVVPYGISFNYLAWRTRFLLFVCGSVLFGALLPVYFNPHYVAPITCAVYALVLTAMQNLRRWRPSGKPAGVALVRSVPLIAFLMLILCIAVPTMRSSGNPQMATWYSPIVVNSYRAQVMSQLSREPGLQLVIVRYSPDHIPIAEWVFNSADIDHSKVVWARDMGPEKNAELLRYFSGRRVWLIEPDKIPPKLCKYSVSGSDTEQLRD